MSQDRDIFRRFISDSLAKNPDWLRDAIEAVSSGAERAIASLREERGQFDLAMRTALIMASGNRINAHTRVALNTAIIRAISKGPGLSPVERQMLARLLDEQEKGLDTAGQHTSEGAPDEAER